MTRQNITALAILLLACMGLSSCFKSNKMNAKQGGVVSEGKPSESAEQSGTDEDLTLPSTHDDDDVGGAEPFKAEHNEEETTVDRSLAGVGMCARFIKTFNNEPRFYHLQATIKAAEQNNQTGEFVRSHMIYHRIAGKYSSQPTDSHFKDCASIILSFDRFGDVLALKRLASIDRLKVLQQRLESSQAAGKHFAAIACVDLIAKHATKRKFEMIQDQIIQKKRHSVADSFMAELLTEKSHGMTDGDAQISARACLTAMSKLTLENAQAFAKAETKDQLAALGVDTSNVAH